MSVAVASPPERPRIPVGRYVKKALKRVVPLALGVYFIPYLFGAYFLCGLLDVLRNSRRTLRTIDSYFAGNGTWTWLLSPFNLLIDLLCLPYWNRGVYKLTDLPTGHQDEIKALIDAAYKRNVVGLLDEKLGANKRGMIFFKWYGKNFPVSVDVPEFHQKYRYIRTIGVSIFNKRSSTGRHFGPLRVTLRVLYNINDITDPNVYIEVGKTVQRWRDEKLFIFDDTLQHQSVNESDAVRYCMFVDILRPSLLTPVLGLILTGIRLGMAPFRAMFYKHWTFLK